MIAQDHEFAEFWVTDTFTRICEVDCPPHRWYWERMPELCEAFRHELAPTPNEGAMVELPPKEA